ncbi:MAG: response regulator [Candidatus Competibacter sp.]|nr:response regulator [Candidatus Competibacter sp.]MDG4584566.1 response regulator [Candidatus Competibacter sp.]
MNADFSKNSGRPIDILLAEDNPADARLTCEALADGKVANRIHVVDDGIKAMAFLRRLPPYQDAPCPDIVLLDLNMPRMDGREVLAEIKSDPLLKMLPVVVLTTSQAEEDILRAYQLQANCYVTKPVDLDQLIKVVSNIENFWFSIVRLPSCPN